ncbi:hypothetical protein I302_103673 [Kwoniella bestiolae CBS 10118]|uniref:F-box domain-containing protein n=1 Tax=Kwoniella bestiolae CBS 10118 TaxID=1296100 RepID=A0A1B9G954_9TREE|nr:hypothetical protein I302_02378 [Kwoniella bestiolae CBS 10118]OCF27536.1 hypothetical protein I302_02378 [Kwoniella bestiolae CBS 10118]
MDSTSLSPDFAIDPVLLELDQNPAHDTSASPPGSSTSPNSTEASSSATASHISKQTKAAFTPKKDSTSAGKRKNSESTEEDVVPKKKARKPLLAKRVEWNDIPDWEGREDCPLLELPGEILDMCFGLSVDVGLSMRDYVSLAGVSKLFRHRMNDTVFKELYYAAEPRSMVKPTTNEAHRIFTRTSPPDWRLPKKEKFSYPSASVASHYKPRGMRIQWTEAQYIVYKEEQYFWRLGHRREKARVTKNLEKIGRRILQEEREKEITVHLGSQHRKVIGRVRGRENGEPPVQKDDEGKPKEEYYLDITKRWNELLDPKDVQPSNDQPLSKVPDSFRRRLEKKIKW